MACASCGKTDDPEPCELELAMAPEYLGRKLYILGSKPGQTGTLSADSNDWSPYTRPLVGRGLLERVVTNQDDYRAFQKELDGTLGRVDFQAHDVLGVKYSTGGTCGADALYELLALPEDGSAVLSVDIYDGSLGQPTSCATFDEAVIVVEVPKTARPQVCVTMYGWPQ